MTTKRRDAFQQVVTDAINDLLEFGFDSQERLDRWTQRLEQAARASLVPESVLDRSLRDMLLRVYERTVDNDRLIQRHKGISQFTLASIKPKLRGELDRRILASANLIRLNREASIQKTIQRFSGWATSIPTGQRGEGWWSDVEDRTEIKAAVRKGIAGLPFEERRVIIDQGHKLAASINEIVAIDGGAIGGFWHHVKEGGGYQARPEHEKRDGKFYLLRDSWAIQKGYIRKGSVPYYDTITAVGQEVYCRCWMTWIFNLRDIPQECMTRKGEEALAEARQRIAGWSNESRI